LIERINLDGTEKASTGRGYSYKATLNLLEHLGVTRKDDLPEYKDAFKKIEEFVKAHSSDGPIEQASPVEQKE
jgi:chromosome segregation and condensation protein ScpB